MPEELPDIPEEPQADASDQPEDAASAALRAAQEALASIQAEANAAASGTKAEPEDDLASKSQVEADAEALMLAELMASGVMQSSAQVASAPAVATPSGGGPVDLGPPPRGSKPLPLPDFDLSGVAGAQHGLDLLADVRLDVRIELGRTRMLVEDVLKLNAGAVVELDKLAGDPLDVFVNDRLVARGEVLVLNDNFCIRVNEIIDSVGEGEESQDS